ncbi:S8 family serine peptidase [Arthrobacter halodurans]|uniref:S8 family serine peptidase n=1 Tax=Arthrobacter halodurans TaxID=516699 RepID=A0ABV4URL8_9MICC
MRSRFASAVVATTVAALAGSLAFAGPAAAAPDAGQAPVSPAPIEAPVKAAPTDLVPKTDQPEREASAATDRLIVEFKDGADSSAERKEAYVEVAEELDTTVREVRSSDGVSIVTTGETLDAGEVKDAVAALEANPDVAYAEPDALMQIAAEPPNDELYHWQWSYNEETAGLRLAGAWDIARGAGVTVAVVDTGSTPHPDLDANTVPGYDFISTSALSNDGGGRDADPNDEGDFYAAGQCGSNAFPSTSSWHGTHVAGTIAAVTGNGIGVAGVAPEARIQHVRALGACGGYTSDIADAITWASGGTVAGVPANPTPAAVVNLSLGGYGACSAYSQNAIDGAVARGVTVVVAAGNENDDTAFYNPANCDNTVVVAATGQEGSRASYSNYGFAVDVAAPGGDSAAPRGNGILSTLNTGSTVQGEPAYATYQGTSMATPHVAGVAALMKVSHPTLTPAEVEERLKTTARTLPGTCPEGCGTGLVDARAAVDNRPPEAPKPPVTAGVPTITGVASRGTQLTANPGIWTPADTTFTYKWRADGVDIPGVSGSVYTPYHERAGQRISVVVTGSREGYSPVSVASAETEPVKMVYITAGVPSVTGTMRVGQTLTADPGVWLPEGTPLHYQWLRDGHPIGFSTAKTYKLAANDVGTHVTVQVTGATNDIDGLVQATSPETERVQPGTLTSNAPVMVGDPIVGSTLSINQTPWSWPAATDVFYQWYADGVLDTNRNASSTVLGVKDLGKRITAKVTGHKPGYTDLVHDVATSGPVTEGTMEDATITIAGVRTVGGTLTATVDSAASANTYQWMRAGTPIAGATGRSYTLVAADLGKEVAVRTTGTATGYRPLDFMTAAGIIGVGTLTAPVPKRAGTARTDSVLSISTDPWTAGTKLTYQWYRGTAPISGATASTYRVKASDVGGFIWVRVTGTKAGYTTVVRDTPMAGTTGNATLPSTTPRISGTVKIGGTLTASAWTSDVRKSYQWYRSGRAIYKATGSTYKVATADAGHGLSVRVRGSKAGYQDRTFMSMRTAAVPGLPLRATAPKVTGTLKVGNTVKASVGTWTTGTKRTYQWYRSGKAVFKATGYSYRVTTLDAGHTLTVKVTGTKAGYATRSMTSAKTAKVPYLVLSASTPKIVGTLKVGYTLKASVGTWTTGTKRAYQWYRSGKAIPRATGYSYRLTTSDRSGTIKVRVVGSKTGYASVTKYSSYTARVR